MAEKKRKLEGEEAIKAFLVNKIKMSGYSLQNDVENKLEPFFTVNQEEPYLDKDKGEGRTFDLHAFKFIPDLKKLDQNKKHVIGQVQLIIECKNLSGHAWLFFKQNNYSFNFPEFVTIAEAFKPDPFKQFINITPFQDLFDAHSYDEHVFDEKRTNNKINNLFEAIMTVTKATRYEIDSTLKTMTQLLSLYQSDNTLKRMVAFYIFQPVIVFRGKMFGVSQVKDEPVLEPISFAQIPKQYVSKNYNEMLGQIHIVSYDALDRYVQILLAHYWKREEQALKDQESLSEFINKILSLGRSQP